MNPSQLRIYGYLIQLIGKMITEGERRFLLFISGSSALVVAEINVGFNDNICQD